MLFRLRYNLDDSRERKEFVSGLDFEWDIVSENEKLELGEPLVNATGPWWKDEERDWFKVDWERVPELVMQRRVLLKAGVAYVPQREQLTLVVTEFSAKLDVALEVRFAHLSSLNLH